VDRTYYIRAYNNREGGIPSRVATYVARKDLALVELGGTVPPNVVPLPIAGNEPSPGQKVHSLGSPGVSGGLWVYTPGEVRSLVPNKPWVSGTEGSREVNEYEADMIEATSPTNAGDSGGPLVNDRLHLVGVTQGVARNAQSMSQFVNATEVKRLLTAYYKEKGIKPPVESAPSTTEDVASIGGLVKALSNPDAGRRAQAAASLGQLGADAKAAITPLVALLKDKDENVRKSAAEALEQIGSLNQSHLSGLAAALKDANVEVRAAAAAALGKLGSEGEEAVKPLTAALKDSEALVKQKAAASLAQLGSLAKDAVLDLSGVLKDASPDVRAEAAAALGKIGTDAKPAVSALGASLIKDHNRQVKLKILEALGSIGTDASSAVPQITKALKERDKDIKDRAIAALGEIGGKEAIRSLVEQFEARELRPTAEDALVKIGKPALNEINKALQNKSADIRLGAVETLAKMGPDAPNALATLMAMSVRERDARVVQALKKTIEKLRDK
jgi:HEAT repeat protein